MTTRLSNDMRTDIINSVLKATNYMAQRAEINAKLQQAAKAFIIESQPDGWYELIKGKPAEWFKLQAALSVAPDRHPMSLLPDIDSVYDFHQQYEVKLEDPVVVAEMIGKSDAFFSAIKDITKDAKTLAAWYEDTSGQLRSLLASYQSAEKLIERMPELKAHVTKIVKIQKTFPLVAPSNALAMLTKMGFDQTVKK